MLVGAIPHALLTSLPIVFAGITGLVLAGASLMLPDLPAAGRNERMNLAAMVGLDAVSQMRDRSFWAVCLCAALLSIPLAFYNAYFNNFLQEAGATITVLGKTFEPTAIQALGQVSELSFLLLLPYALRLVGIGGVLVVGMVGWVLRASLFALGFSGTGDTAIASLLAGILLHGVCYDFILIGSALYVDQAIRTSARSRAQSFLTMITMGAGVMIGSVIANTVYDIATIDASTHDWALMWAVAGGIALLALGLFLALFRGWSPRGVEPRP